jgi:hypothetical protein
LENGLGNIGRYDEEEPDEDPEACAVSAIAIGTFKKKMRKTVMF